MFTEPTTKRGEKWFRFAFKLEDKEAHFDVGGTKEEVEFVEKRIEDFLTDVTCETRIVEVTKKEKSYTFGKLKQMKKL